MAVQREEKEKIVRDFGKDSSDTGSTEVQVALLTKDILQLTDHCKENKKDFSSRRGLIKKVCQRKGLLLYLGRTNEEKYKELIGKLGLRR